MSYETLIVETDGRVATIQLNRPEAMNALNSTLVSELAEAVETLGSNDKIRVIILTGNEKAFAAGADIKEMADKSFADVFTSDMFGAEISSIGRCRKPIIAAVSGFALGGGCELAMLCDMIICADTAKFGQPEVNLGVMPGIGGSQRLTRFVGKSKAMDMCLTGRFMDAEEAERSGLVARVVPAKKLIESAKEIAEKIADKSSLSVMAIKEAVDRSYETTLAEGLLFEKRMFHALFSTEDQAEGMSAFAEKRAPKFRNK